MYARACGYYVQYNFYLDAVIMYTIWREPGKGSDFVRILPCFFQEEMMVQENSIELEKMMA